MSSPRKIMLYLVPFIIFICLGSISEVNAAPRSIEMTVEEGFNGNVKVGRSYPIRITLYNPGPDFSGDLLVTYSIDYNLGGEKAIRVELPQGTEKTYEIIVPEASYHQTNLDKFIFLYENNWKTGKEVTLVGPEYSSARLLDNETTVGILSENPDRIRSIQLIELHSRKTTIAPLSKINIPEDEAGLDFFDYLVIDDYPLGELTTEQQQAVVNFVKNGGVILVGASSKGNHAYAELEPYLPMRLQSQISTQDLEFLQVDGEQPQFNSLNIYNGDLKSDSIIVQASGNKPVVVKSDLENGTIIQTAFSLGEAPLSQWNNFSDYIESLLSRHVRNVGLKIDGVYRNMYYEIGRTNELFPSSNFSIGAVILIMIGYILIVIPILYIVLKRLDKREHSWWVIPAISIFISIGIFAIGAKDRIAKPQLSEMGVFKVEDDGKLSGVYAATIFSNRSGNYELTVPKDQFNGVPVNAQESLIDRSRNTVVTETRNEQTFHFNDVGYWSGRTIVGFANTDVPGSLNMDLELRDGKIVGTVSNHFSFGIEDLSIWNGNQIYELGNLQENETLDVEVTLSNGVLSRPIHVQSYSSNQDLDEMKKEALKDVISYSNLAIWENSPIIFGYTKDAIMETDLVNKNEKNDRVQLLYQPLHIEGSISGSFTITDEQLSIQVIPVVGQIFEPLDMYNMIGLEDGIYEVEISFPEQLDIEKTTFHSIEFTIIDRYAPVEFAFYDFNSGEFIPVEEGNQADILSDDPGRFISPEGRILIEMVKKDDDYSFFSFPEFTVKGAVNP